MSKTKEELETLKNEVYSFTSKVKELTEEEMKVVFGGVYLAGRTDINKEMGESTPQIDENAIL